MPYTIQVKGSSRSYQFPDEVSREAAHEAVRRRETELTPEYPASLFPSESGKIPDLTSGRFGTPPTLDVPAESQFAAPPPETKPIQLDRAGMLPPASQQINPATWQRVEESGRRGAAVAPKPEPTLFEQHMATYPEQYPPTVDPAEIALRASNFYNWAITQATAANQGEFKQQLFAERAQVMPKLGVHVIEVTPGLPEAKLPRVPQQEGTLGQVGAGLANAAIGLGQFFVSPEGLMTMLVPGRMTSVLWGSEMTSSLPGAAKALGQTAGESAVSGDIQTPIEAGAGVAFTGVMGPKLLKQAAMGNMPLTRPAPAAPVFKTEQAKAEAQSAAKRGTPYVPPPKRTTETKTPNSKPQTPDPKPQTPEPSSPAKETPPAPSESQLTDISRVTPPAVAAGIQTPNPKPQIPDPGPPTPAAPVDLLAAEMARIEAQRQQNAADLAAYEAQRIAEGRTGLPGTGLGPNAPKVETPDPRPQTPNLKPQTPEPNLADAIAAIAPASTPKAEPPATQRAPDAKARGEIPVPDKAPPSSLSQKSEVRSQKSEAPAPIQPPEREAEGRPSAVRPPDAGRTETPTQPPERGVEVLFDVPREKTIAGQRVQIIRMLEKLEEEDPVTGEFYPRDGQEERVTALRIRLAEIENQIQGKPAAPKPPAPPVSALDEFDKARQAIERGRQIIAQNPPPILSQPKPSTAKQRYADESVVREDDGRWVLTFSKAKFDQLGSTTKANLRKYFNWSPTRNAWMSKTAKDDFWTRNLARELELQEIGKPFDSDFVPKEKVAPITPPRETAAERAARLEREYQERERQEQIRQQQARQAAEEAQNQNAWLSVNVPDVTNARKVVADVDAAMKPLNEDYNMVSVRRKVVEGKVISKTGPRWNRGNFKKSASRKDLADYESLGNQLRDLDTQINALNQQAESSRRLLRQATLAERVNDPAQSLFYRLGARLELLFVQGAEAPEALIKAFEAETRSELQRLVPDLTAEEIQRMLGHAMRLGEVGSDLKSSLSLDPQLNHQLWRREALLELFRNTRSEVGIPEELIPSELLAELDRKIPGWKSYRVEGKPQEPILQADMARLRDEMAKLRDVGLAEKERQRLEAEARTKAEADELAKAEVETRQLISEAEQISGSMGKREATLIKNELLDRIRAAIEKAPDELGAGGALRRRAIGVPGDGIFVVENTKKALRNLFDRAKKISTSKSMWSEMGKATSPRPPKQGVFKQAGGTAKAEKWLADNVQSQDEARLALYQVYSDGERLVATDGRKIVEFTQLPTKPSPHDSGDAPFPVGQANDRIKFADKATVEVSTESLWRAARMARPMNWEKDFPKVELWVDTKGNLYSETVDDSRDFGSYGVKPKAAKSLGKYNADYLETLAEAALMAGNEKVRIGKWAVSADEWGLALNGEGVRAVLAGVNIKSAQPAAAAGGEGPGNAKGVASPVFHERGGEIAFTSSNATVTKPGLVTIPGARGGTMEQASPAYHGTPHKVDKFSTAKIGTGEGAQAYGWGLYFAENLAVAKNYAETLGIKKGSTRVPFITSKYGEATRIVTEAQRKAARLLERWHDKGRFAAENAIQSEPVDVKSEFWKHFNEFDGISYQDLVGGYTYAVELKAEPDELLDWDKPLSEQPEKFQSILRVMWQRARASFDAIDPKANPTVSQLYHLYSSHRGNNAKAVSEEMAAAGIKGIRYLDQGSRGVIPVKVYGGWLWNDKIYSTEQAAIDANKSYNYVIFNESDIQITHENGRPVTMQQAAPGFGVAGGLLGGEPGQPPKAPRWQPMPEDNPNFTSLPVDLPEAVVFARDLLGGIYPVVRQKLRALGGEAAGVFKFTEGENAKGRIELAAKTADLLTDGEKAQLRAQAATYARQMSTDPVEQAEIAEQRYQFLEAEAYADAKTRAPVTALKVLWHEIGHAVDWLPQKLIAGRGNLFGRVASLKDYLKHVIALDPTRPAGHAITPAERLATRKLAESQLRDELGPIIEIVRTIVTEEPELRIVGVTPEDIRALFGMSAREEMPELYRWFSEQSGQVKREIVRSAMRGVLDERLAALGKTEPTGKMRKVTRTVREKSGREPTDPEIQERFRALLREEIRRRNLAEIGAVRAELEGAIAWWRGTSTMPAYFKQGPEMFAEAFSIFMNNPAALQKRAPTYARLLWNYLDRKPEVKRLYDQVQTDLRAGTVETKRVKELLDAFARDDRDSLLRDHEKLTKGDLLENVRYHIDRRFGPIYAAVKGSDMEGPVEKAIGDFLYRQTEHELFLNRLNRGVGEPMAKANLDWNWLGEYMYHQRVIHERFKIFNPLGWHPKASADRLQAMAAQLGPERWAALERAHAAFRSLYEQHVIEPMRRSGMFKEDLLTLIDANNWYATFSVRQGVPDAGVERLLAMSFGADVGARIYRQVGTVKEIKNPATATVLKSLSLISAMARNEARRVTVEALRKNDPRDVVEAQKRWTGKRWEYIPRETDKVGTVVFMRNGQPQAYYVRKVIADALNKGGAVENLLMQQAVGATQWLKGLYTQLNFGFWPFNFVRDTASYWVQMPGVTAPLHWLKNLPRAFAAARASVKGIANPAAESALARRMLISRADPRGVWAAADNQYEAKIASYGLNPAAWKMEGDRVHTLVKLWNGYRELGQTIERANKINAMLYLDEKHPGMEEWKKRQIVRERGGSPDFMQRGVSNPYIDFFAMFYNPWKESLRSLTRSARENPWSFGAKTTAFVAAPTILMALAAAGAFGPGLRKLYGAPSDSDTMNYLVVPLGWENEAEGKAAYLRLPLWEPARILHGLLWHAITGRGRGAGQFYAGTLPSINALLDVAKSYLEWEVSNKNPVDSFTGNHWLDEQEFAAGGWDARAEMLKTAWNKLGGGLLWRFDDKQRWAPPESETSKLLALPGIANAVGRWIKISDRGWLDAARNLVQPSLQERAQDVLAARVIISKMLQGGPLTDAELRLIRDPHVFDYIRRTLPEDLQKSKLGINMRLMLQMPNRDARNLWLQQGRIPARE